MYVYINVHIRVYIQFFLTPSLPPCSSSPLRARVILDVASGVHVKLDVVVGLDVSVVVDIHVNITLDAHVDADAYVYVNVNSKLDVDVDVGVEF